MIEDHIQLVKSQISWLWNEGNRYPPDHPKYNPDRTKTYSDLVDKHKALLGYLEGQQAKQANKAGNEPIGKRLGDLSDLPPELRKQLVANKADDLESQILDVIEDLNSIASIDEILVHLYRQFQVVQDRRYLAGKLGRMVKKDLVIAVEGKRGQYALKDSPFA